jgi:plastocyanin
MKHIFQCALLCTSLIPTYSLAATYQVFINNYAFQPTNITIHPGDKVVWINKDDVDHTVSALNGSFDSGALDAGARFQFIFRKMGNISYRCSVHPEMKGSVKVVLAQ